MTAQASRKSLHRVILNPCWLNKKDSSSGGGQSAADYYAQHGQYGAPSAPAPAPAPAPAQQQFTELDDDDGDLPF